MTNSTPTVVNRVDAESALEGPSDTEQFRHDYFPKFTNLSKSHWELWIFDAVDPSGRSAVTMTFFRDGSQLKLNKGPIRATFQATLPDGSTVRGEDFAKESIIEAGADSIQGRWISAKEGSVRFDVELNHSEATVTFDIPTIKGTLNLRRTSHTPPQVSTSDEADLLAPTCYYVHSLPRALAQVDFTFPQQDKKIQFSGYGGSDHTYMTAPTPVIMEECTYVRGHAGPYTICLMRIVSKVEPGKTFAKVTLVKDEEVVFTCTSDDRISLTEDYFCFRAAHGGAVRGNFGDSTSGYRLDMVSPKSKKHWLFDLTHQVLWWSMPTAPPPAKTGNNGFVDLVMGGEVGGQQYAGSGTLGHVTLPYMKSAYSGFNNHDS